MIPINLPPFGIKLKGPAERPRVFDELRRRYVTLTPEEWVRQHFVHYLSAALGYPAALMANEVQLLCGQKRLRADTVVYGRDGQPVAIVEYKAPTVPITARVIEQVCAYNLMLHVGHLMVSNGLVHRCCRVDYECRAVSFLDHIPTYDELTRQ